MLGQTQMLDDVSAVFRRLKRRSSNITKIICLSNDAPQARPKNPEWNWINFWPRSVKFERHRLEFGGSSPSRFQHTPLGSTWRLGSDAVKIPSGREGTSGRNCPFLSLFLEIFFWSSSSKWVVGFTPITHSVCGWKTTGIKWYSYSRLRVVMLLTVD